ncbi:MAG: glycosyltransferase family 39 protein [Chloroflexi bacterium]|nr:glycosyltransferase family 39 protein [Chloroflexota bacterium]
MGNFHHGVLYYYLLAPVAAVLGADPLAVVGAIAVAGVTAVAVVWWLARAMAGPVAAIVAAGLMAVSASAIEESTFIWNPNIIALSSALALAAAWRAWTSGRARWWIAAVAAQTVTMHGHVLGSVMLVPLGALLLAEAARRSGGGRRRVIGAGLVGLALMAASYLPLLLHETASGFAETRAVLDYLGGGGGDAPSLAVRLAVVPLRILSWPLTGLITDQPLAGIAAAAAVVAILVWRVRDGRGSERTAAAWLAATLLWSAVALAIAASSLGSVVRGLPNDHYHAFLDPVVFVAVGLGVAALWRHGHAVGPGGRAALAAAVTAVLAVVAINVAIRPPPVASDHGYPAAERAARRIIDALRGQPYALAGLPELKSTDAYGFPLTRLGAAPTAGAGATRLVVACDRLLEPLTGAAGAGAAEAELVVRRGGGWTLVERFDASPRTVISIYAAERP